MKKYCLFLAVFTTFAFGADRKEICKNVFQAANDDFQLAIVDLAENRPEAALARAERGTLSEDQKLLLWRLLSGRPGKRTAAELERLHFADETLRGIVAELAVSDPATCLALLPRTYDNPDQLFSLLKDLATGIDLGPARARLSELNEAQRAELATRQIELIGEASFLPFQKHYALSSPDAISKVMAALLRRGWYEPGELIGADAAVKGFTEEQREKMAVAFCSSEEVLENWETFEQLAETLRVSKLPLPSQIEIAGTIFATNTNRDGWEAKYFNELFEDNGFEVPFTYTTANATDVLVAAFKKITRERLKEQEERDNFLFAAYGNRAIAMAAGVQKLKKAIFAHDGMETIAATFNLETLEELHLVDEPHRRDLTRTLREFAEENPELLPKEFVGLLWEPVRNQSIALKMLNEYLFQNEGRWDRVPSNSLELISDLSGLPYETLRDSPLSRNPGELYALLMDIQSSLKHPAFSEIRIEPGVFAERREFLTLLRTLRDLHALEGDGTKTWKKVLAEIGVQDEINANGLEALRHHSTYVLIAKVREKLKEHGVQFTPTQFEALGKQWGDLEPIWTLLSRFEGDTSWKQEIDPLGQVFKAALDGTFHEKKFGGGFTLKKRSGEQDIQMAKAQFENIVKTKAQRAAWTKPRWKVSLPGTEPKDVTAVAERTRAILASDVVAPLSQRLTAPKKKPTKQFLKSIDWEGELLQQDPRPLVEKLVEDWALKTGVEKSQAAAALLLHTFGEMTGDGSALKLRGTIRVARALMVSHPEVQAEAPKTIRQVLSNAETSLRELETKSYGEILLTVSNADPKFLLTIGDAVQTSSCQSYSTGGRIEALLGYVMDANVQAVVSYSLSQQHFETAGAFNEVAKAQAEGRLLQVAFDGNLKIATFTLQPAEGNPIAVRTLPLGYAHQRQMLKLGESEGGPGVRLEQLYEQKHPESETMQGMHEEILADLVRELRIRDNELPMTVPPSRNPGGVYSDLAESLTAGEYEIP